jgi:DNA-binding Lrp family transcriptional regulator
MDEIDQKIINALRQNSKLTYGSIGNKIGFSEAAVRKRVKNMLKDGVIKKFTIEVNQKSNAIVLISVNNLYSTSAVSEKLQKIDGIESVSEITGQFDVFVTISAPNMIEVNKCVDAIREIEGVSGTNTMMVLKSWN